MNTKISIIAAMDKHNVIGINNKLPWHIPEDLKRFKKLTTGHTVVMGRKTFESIGKPLPNRKNIVISRDENLVIPGCHVSSSPEDAILYQTRGEKEVFIIGGQTIYEQTLHMVNNLYITHIRDTFKGDAYFPDIHKHNWTVTGADLHVNNKDYDVYFVNYRRRR